MRESSRQPSSAARRRIAVGANSNFSQQDIPE